MGYVWVWIRLGVYLQAVNCNPMEARDLPGLTLIRPQLPRIYPAQVRLSSSKLVHG